jgi:anti-anti-sigma regulatory factor
VTFIDAGTVDVIVAARERQRANGRDLHLSNASGIVRRVLDALDLDDLLVATRP